MNETLGLRSILSGAARSCSALARRRCLLLPLQPAPVTHPAAPPLPHAAPACGIPVRRSHPDALHIQQSLSRTKLPPEVSPATDENARTPPRFRRPSRCRPPADPAIPGDLPSSSRPGPLFQQLLLPPEFHLVSNPTARGVSDLPATSYPSVLQPPSRKAFQTFATRPMATTIITKKGKDQKKTPAPESNIPTTSNERQCFKCHKPGHISSECTTTTITNEEICSMTSGNSHTTGCDASMLGRKKADDYSDGDSKAASKSDCDIDYSFSDDEGFLFNLSLNNKVSQSTSSNFSHRSTSSKSVERQQKHTSQRTIGASPERDPGSKPEKCSFDIFRTTNVGLVKLSKSIYVLNKEKKRDSERFKNAPEPQYLRSGMVLLKNFISNADQVNVLNKCRELGIGSGGFYRPGYRNGTKLHLQMMCLGKDWDPDSKLYKDSRLLDNAVPPEIPGEFKKLVDGALHTAHNFLRQSSKSVEKIPNMSPDVCIVNFYDNSGKLGLHQDIDESKESLEKGLPVVSLSVGDSAEFLYGDVRDADKAEKVILESGDVLIFGGKSRLIFHGVTSVKPNTAPTFLSNQTPVRPGRLNLTFRQV